MSTILLQVVFGLSLSGAHRTLSMKVNRKALENRGEDGSEGMIPVWSSTDHVTQRCMGRALSGVGATLALLLVKV